MNALTYAKYPVWTVGQYLRHPYNAIRNTYIVLAAFWRTIVIGRRAIRVLRRHTPVCTGHREYPECQRVYAGDRAWRDRTRSRYNWRLVRRFWAPWILERAGIDVRVIGYDRVDWSRSHVIVVNHQSVLDVLLLVATIPFARFVAKREVLSYPIVGALARVSAQAIIDRADHAQSMAAIRATVQADPTVNLIFFAEGTRSHDGRLGEFKKGPFAIAKEAKLPIVPLALSGAHKALPKGSLLRLKSGARLTLEFGHPIDILEHEDVPTFARRVHTLVAMMLLD
ncbi:MAG: lysophospholipid acyltransferase family protein [Patescibacteria group bacterium]